MRTPNRVAMMVAAIVALLEVAVVVKGSEVPAKPTAAGEVYQEALGLEKAGKLSQAAQAFEHMIRDWPGTTKARMSLRQLAGVQAMMGRIDEACETYVRYRLADLTAAKEKLPAEGGEMDKLRAEAMGEMAEACMSGPASRLEKLNRAKALYEELLRRFPHSRLATEARKGLDWVKSEIKKESSREAARKEIEKQVARFEKAIKHKDAEGIVSLLAPSVDADEAGRKLRALFKSPRYKVCHYDVRRVDFDEDMKRATVAAKAVVAGATKQEPRVKHFFFVRTVAGWKLRRL